MLSRIIGVFMPYKAMYHHAKFVLNENKLVKEEMEVINEWKAARLEELNFVGIVVRLHLYCLLDFSTVFNKLRISGHGNC